MQLAPTKYNTMDWTSPTLLQIVKGTKQTSVLAFASLQSETILVKQ